MIGPDSAADSTREGGTHAIQVHADSSVKAGQNVAQAAESAVEGAVHRWAGRSRGSRST